MAQDPEQLWWSLYRNGVLAGTNGLLALSTAMTPAHLAQIAEVVTGVADAASRS